jgi:hypothetical protein
MEPTGKMGGSSAEMQRPGDILPGRHRASSALAYVFN